MKTPDILSNAKSQSIFRFPALIISMIFILSGAVNNGFSGQLFALPFWILFALAFGNFQRIAKIRILIILFCLYLPLKWNHDSNPIIYNVLDKKITLIGKWHYVTYINTPNKMHLSPPSNVDFSWKGYSTVGNISTPTTLKITSIETSHADFGTDLIPVFEDSHGNQYRIFASSIRENISEGFIESSDLSTLEPHEYQTKFSKAFSMLMMYPLIPILLSKN